MKKYLKYIIITTIIDAIIGAVVGIVTVKIINTKKIISADYKALKKFFNDMGGKATHIKLSDLDEDEVPEDIRRKADDPRDPLDPTVIKIYD